jgi:hypothetical protein
MTNYKYCLYFKLQTTVTSLEVASIEMLKHFSVKYLIQTVYILHHYSYLASNITDIYRIKIS